MSDATVKTLINVFQQIETVIAYDESWDNGTGYIDGIVRAKLGLENGTRFKCMTTGKHVRQLVGVVTCVGNFVFFAHHSHPDQLVSYHRPTSLRGLFTGNVADEDLILGVMGGEFGNNYNLGQTLDLVLQKVNSGKPRHPANQPGFPSLTPADHQRVAMSVADRMNHVAAGEEFDINTIWNDEYHKVLLEKDFAGDELSQIPGYVQRNPELRESISATKELIGRPGLLDNIEPGAASAANRKS